MADYLPEVPDPKGDEAHRRNSRIVEKLRAAATLIEIAVKVDGDLPEVMSVGVNGDEITIQPWLPGAPVKALGHFEPLMTGPIERKAFPLVLEGEQTVSLLSVAGDVDGQRVVVSASTYRDTPVDGFLGVTEATVAELAASETVVDLSDPTPDLVKQELSVPAAIEVISVEQWIEDKDDDGDDRGASGAGDDGGPSPREG